MAEFSFTAEHFLDRMGEEDFGVQSDPFHHLSAPSSRFWAGRAAGGPSEVRPFAQRLGGQRQPGQHAPAERHARDSQVQEEVQL